MDLPKATVRAWLSGTSPGICPLQARVLILDLELPQGHNILPACVFLQLTPSRVVGWGVGLGPKNSTVMDGSHTGTGSA